MREDWIEIELGDLLKLKNGFAFKAKDYIDEGIPVFRIGDINDWNVSDVNAKRIEEKPLYDDYIVENGDILIAMSGATTGKFGIYNSENKAYQNQRVGNLKPYSDEYINKSFIFYLLYSLKRKIEEDAYGGAQPNISATKIEALKTKLAPLPIQRAIVSKIESLFADLDHGIANLKKAQEQLKIYRQAVLKKAFEGELTKEWREKQRTDAINGISSPLPTAEELLQQIKEERQNHYNQQIEDWKKAVKEWETVKTQFIASQKPAPKKPTKPKAIKELPPLSEDELKVLPKLPSGWVFIKQGNVIEEPKYGTSKKCDYKTKGVGVLRIPNISDKNIDSSDLKFAEFTDDEIKLYELKVNDILTIRSNGSVDLVGKCALIKKQDENFLYAGYLIRLRPFLGIINSKFLIHSLSSISLRMQIEDKAKSTSGVNNINSGELSNLIIPFCSIPEQHQIVQEIESRLSVCDKMEHSISESLEKANALRQSILKKAFEGRLLSESEIEACKQEEDYEPASVLLEKIKAEKLKREQEAKKTKKKSRK